MIKDLREKYYDLYSNLFLAKSISNINCSYLLKLVDGLLIPFSSNLRTKSWCYPTKATEYMNTNLPIFSSNLPILNSCFGTRAIYFEVDDYRDLANKIISYKKEFNFKKFWESKSFPLWEFRANQIYNCHMK